MGSRGAADREPSRALVPVSRRTFLRYAGLTGLVVTFDQGRSVIRVMAAPGDIIDPPSGLFTRTVRRRQDLFVATFEFRNLKLVNGKLSRQQAGQPSYIGVVLPPQHLTERALALGGPVTPPGSIASRLAGQSRLAFRVPGSVLPLDFKLDELLKWSQFALQVVPAADPAAANKAIREPTAIETAIELPWFLVLSPDALAAFAHATQPVTRAGRTELWHTRLAARGASAGTVVETSSPKPVQAVWARDSGFDPALDDNPQPGPFAPPDANALTPDDRAQIVRLTSDHDLDIRQPVQVNRMMLSALGGWLDSRGVWNVEGSDFSVEDWRHIAQMGRDSYVRIVRVGFLAPFGHKAARVRITERRFVGAGNGNLGAYLTYKTFIVVRQPVKDYGGGAAPGEPNDSRQFPFRSLRILTQTTPDLDDPQPQEFTYIPHAGGQPVQFSFVGTDWVGQETAFTAPVMWIDQSVAYDTLGLNAVKFSYNGINKNDPKRKRPAGGQRVAFAPEKQGGDTSFEVASLVLQAVEHDPDSTLDQLKALGQLPFYPGIEEAGVTLAAAEQAAGQALGESLVKVAQPFLDHGFDGLENLGETFLETVGSGPLLDFAKDAGRIGGVATPNLGVSGLTRRLGPVGGAIEELAKGNFDPLDYLDPAAKLLGNVKLGDVLEVLEGLDGIASSPLIKTTFVPEPPALPKQVVTKLDFEPKLKSDPLHIFAPDGDSGLTLHAEVITDLLNPAASTFSVVGDLRNFAVNLIGDGPAQFLILHVKRVKFTTGKDAAPDLDFVLGEVEFAGVLEFVNELKNFLSSLGKKYGIEVTPAGAAVSLTLPLPSIGVGVFSINNISLGFGGIVPFNGDAARFRFNFCTRENPFKLTVAMFGGGGFFGLECGTDKSVMLEVSLEFGAAVAFDIGVASGGVEIMAGIYMKIEDDNAALTGFLRMGGELGILGIIRISMELYLGFTYHFPPEDKCVGRATFHLEVEILIFSFSINAEIERKFGGENDPTFAQFMTPSNWTDYCEAYAPLGA